MAPGSNKSKEQREGAGSYGAALPLAAPAAPRTVGGLEVAMRDAPRVEEGHAAQEVEHHAVELREAEPL